MPVPVPVPVPVPQPVKPAMPQERGLAGLPACPLHGSGL